ncbi:MAG: ABC transporter permease subunit [Candidatus Lokiarchaeota archaeon]|nr:ABC transporter permease subunit [Candidatus Lokiarchaeota archaeon]
MIRLGLLMKIARKDWREIKSNKQILVPMLALPILVTIIYPLLMIGGPLSDPAGLAEMGGVQVLLDMMVGNLIRPMFVMIPLLITMAIASDAWAGEKERKTAESLFLLPLSDTELFVAKVLASFIPGMLITWGCWVALTGMIDTMVFPYIGYLYMPDLLWLFLVFVFSPILAFFSIFVNVWVSYRAKDTKSAQQIGGSVVTIFIGVLIGGIFGLLQVILVLLTVVFGAIDVVLVLLSPRLFSREAMIAKF